MCVGFALVTKPVDVAIASVVSRDVEVRTLAKPSEDGSSSSDDSSNNKRAMAAPLHNCFNKRPCLSDRGTTPRASKRVRFSKATDTETNDERVDNSSETEVTARDNLWWASQECVEIRANSVETILQFRRQEMDKIRHFMCVHSQCSTATPNLAYLQMIKLDLPEQVRGLEHGIMPSLRVQRQAHIQHVLQMQQRILKNKSESATQEFASKAMRSSQPTCIMAQLLAKEDALAVKQDLMLDAGNNKLFPSFTR